jgi:hypothetical protein
MTKKEKNASGKAGTAAQPATNKKGVVQDWDQEGWYPTAPNLAPPLPGGVQFFVVQPAIISVRQMSDRVETFDEEAERREITRIRLDPEATLTAARQTWRRLTGQVEEQPAKQPKSSKIGQQTPQLVVAMLEFTLSRGGYDTSLRPGTMAKMVAMHAAETGLADGLATDGPLFHLCQAVQRILLERKAAKAPAKQQKQQ